MSSKKNKHPFVHFFSSLCTVKRVKKIERTGDIGLFPRTVVWLHETHVFMHPFVYFILGLLMGMLLILLYKNQEAALQLSSLQKNQATVLAEEFGTYTCTGGGDHGGADWNPAKDCAGGEISGKHTNIGILTIESGETVFVKEFNGTNFGSVSLLAQHATISGSLSAQGKGYLGGTDINTNGAGPGGGTGSSNCALVETGGGAGYGGAGGDGLSGGIGGASYGLATEAAHLGSGGGAGSNGVCEVGGNGGGIIQLIVADTLSVDGALIANGASASGNAGGGSGGSIYITARRFYGTGSITSQGGIGGTFGGGGSGGRIRMCYFDSNEWSGTLLSPSSATVGGIGGTSGTNGTVYVNQCSLPIVQWDSISSASSEAQTAVNLKVVLSELSASDITVEYVVKEGTATESLDYVLPFNSATVSAGTAEAAIPLTIMDDAIDEADETIIVSLTNALNASLGASIDHTYTIIDNEGDGILVGFPTPDLNLLLSLTPQPTATPTLEPTATPTNTPTQFPTQSPTPTVAPTITPTAIPTSILTSTPILTPNPSSTITLTPIPTTLANVSPTSTTSTEPTTTVSNVTGTNSPTSTPTPVPGNIFTGFIGGIADLFGLGTTNNTAQSTNTTTQPSTNTSDTSITIPSNDSVANEERQTTDVIIVSPARRPTTVPRFTFLPDFSGFFSASTGTTRQPSLAILYEIDQTEANLFTVVVMILDNTNKPVPGARVSLSTISESMTTGNDGKVTFSGVRVGEYTITANYQNLVQTESIFVERNAQIILRKALNSLFLIIIIIGLIVGGQALYMYTRKQ